MVLYITGLVLIIVGLAAQAYKTIIKKDRRLSPIFLALFVLGGVVFIVSDFTIGDITGSICGILDTIGTILIAIVFIALLTRRKTL